MNLKKAPTNRWLSNIPWQVIMFYLPLLTTAEKVKLGLLFVGELVSIVYTVLTLINISINDLSVGKLSLSNLPVDLISSVFLSVAFVFGIIQFWKTDKNYEFEKNKDINLQLIMPSQKEEKDGYKAFFLSLEEKHSVLFSQRINTLLREQSEKIILTLLPKEFKNKLLNKLFCQEKSFIKNVLLMQYFASKTSKHKQEFFNDKKISLKSSLSINDFNGDKKSIGVFESDYFSSYLTNDLSMKHVVNGGLKMASNICFPYDSVTQRVKPLERTGFSNHIGVNVVAITKDKQLKLWKQGSMALRSAGLLAPTGSGSLDFEDFEYLKKHNETVTLKQLIEHGMSRELLEESHAKGSKIDNFIVDVKLVGFYRWLSKGGLPGFLGVARLNVDAHQLVANETEVFDAQTTTWEAGNIIELQEIIDVLLAMKDHLSVPLYVNLLHLQQGLIESPESFEFLFTDIK